MCYKYNCMDKKSFTKYCLATSLFELLQDKEYNDISIQDIVDKAGFSRMAYYRNFKDTDEILTYYLSSYTENFIKATKIDYESMGPRQFFITIFEHLGRQETRTIFKVLYERGLIIHLYRQFALHFMSNTEGTQSYQLGFIAGGLFTVYGNWARKGYKEAPEELADIVVGFLK